MQESSKKILNGTYQFRQYLGQGSYGTVFLYCKINENKKNIFNDFFYGKKNSDQEYFALKKYHSHFMKDKEGIDFSALRQINLLNSISHKNIACCHQIIYKKLPKNSNQSHHHEVYAVLDYYLELTEVLSVASIVKNQNDKKLICYQILQGIIFLHNNYIFHRDLKPENIFISRNGQIKISDFGFAKQFGSPHGKYTANTSTKEYRAPQIFFKTHYYTEKCDIWSFGCIIAYIFKNKTLFYSESQTDMEVLGRIFHLRGTPNKKQWESYDKFPYFLRFEETEQKDLQKQLELSAEIASIIQVCLQLNPTKRPSAKQLLNHPFFKGVDGGLLQASDFYDKKLAQILKKNTKSIQKLEEEDVQV